jgi:hypothetical protein
MLMSLSLHEFEAPSANFVLIKDFFALQKILEKRNDTQNVIFFIIDAQLRILFYYLLNFLLDRCEF